MTTADRVLSVVSPVISGIRPTTAEEAGIKLCREFRRDEEEAMGKHEKPPADPSTGNPPPGNSDGQVPPPPPGDGKHKK
ncbi:hypothetical protein [Streptomyces capoamus]|uniref:hypothetical protein n=1 Tax=Streptomyces capoamus TaxID=68183 RepID=UPI003398E1C6